MIIFNKLGIPIGPGFANMFPIVNNFRLEFWFFKQQAVPFFNKNIKDLNKKKLDRQMCQICQPPFAMSYPLVN